jgi:hypothetical protein
MLVDFGRITEGVNVPQAEQGNAKWNNTERFGHADGFFLMGWTVWYRYQGG